MGAAMTSAPVSIRFSLGRRCVWTGLDNCEVGLSRGGILRGGRA